MFAHNLARPDACKDRLEGLVPVTQVACNQDVPRTIRTGKNSVRFGFKRRLKNAQPDFSIVV